jgi:hypothetical protein
VRAWCAALSRGGARWGDRLRRVLLASALCVVVLGVVGMHQLSLGHDFAAPPAAGGDHHGAAHHAVQPEGARQMVGTVLAAHGPHTAPMSADPTGSLTVAMGGQDQTDSGQKIDAPTATWGGPSSVGGDACPDCGHHSMAFSTCLLAMTLLVLTWLLTPPQVRHLPPRWLWRPATVAVLVGRPLPALSLAELSILRT